MAGNTYACLDQFTTAQLEALLCSESERTGAVFHILELMKRREWEHPTGRLPDENEAWAEFQRYYDNIPAGRGEELYGGPADLERAQQSRASAQQDLPEKKSTAWTDIFH